MRYIFLVICMLFAIKNIHGQEEIQFKDLPKRAQLYVNAAGLGKTYMPEHLVIRPTEGGLLEKYDDSNIEYISYRQFDEEGKEKDNYLVHYNREGYLDTIVYVSSIYAKLNVKETFEYTDGKMTRSYFLDKFGSIRQQDYSYREDGKLDEMFSRYINFSMRRPGKLKILYVGDTTIVMSQDSALTRINNQSKYVFEDGLLTMRSYEDFINYGKGKINYLELAWNEDRQLTGISSRKIDVNTRSVINTYTSELTYSKEGYYTGSRESFGRDQTSTLSFYKNSNGTFLCKKKLNNSEELYFFLLDEKGNWISQAKNDPANIFRSREIIYYE